MLPFPLFFDKKTQVYYIDFDRILEFIYFEINIYFWNFFTLKTFYPNNICFIKVFKIFIFIIKSFI